MATTTDTLGARAGTYVMDGAREYLRSHNLTIHNYATAAESLKAAARVALPEAIADAKAALDAHMPDIATATFAATLRLAGIDAAKSWADDGTAVLADRLAIN